MSQRSLVTHRYTLEDLSGWTKQELMEAVQSLEGTLGELQDMSERVRLELYGEEYPFELDVVSGEEEYKD